MAPRSQSFVRRSPELISTDRQDPASCPGFWIHPSFPENPRFLNSEPPHAAARRSELRKAENYSAIDREIVILYRCNSPFWRRGKSDGQVEGPRLGTVCVLAESATSLFGSCSHPHLVS